MDDPLSEVLAEVRLKSTHFFCTQATAPWGVTLRDRKMFLRWHYVARGSCWLAVETNSAPPIALSGGDLVILPHGDGHTLRDDPRSQARRLEDIVGSDLDDSPKQLVIGGSGELTTIVTGSFEFAELPDTPVLATLPPMIRITPDAVAFEQNLQFMCKEAESNRPGLNIVLTRMADIIFIQALRAHIEALPAGAEGFLGALRDTNMGAALGLIHRHPEQPWTVASLADKVGLSRSPFAARFTKLVGEPPLGYLTRIRMQKARTLLRDGATLAKASQLTGYASEASFSHAFRQWAGVAPGAYRRRAQETRSASERNEP